MPVQNLIRCLQSKIMAARDVKEFQLLVDQLDDTESKKHNIYLFFWTGEFCEIATLRVPNNTRKQLCESSKHILALNRSRAEYTQTIS